MSSNVEQISVTGGAGSTLVGNSLGNLMVGNSAADSLNDGTGGDTLTGNSGADLFVYAAASEGGDTITDFTHGLDHIQVSAAGFGGGLINGGATPLVANSNPSSVGASFLYDTDDGHLYWDADGAGGSAASLIATLSLAPTLTSGDILIGA